MPVRFCFPNRHPFFIAQAIVFGSVAWCASALRWSISPRGKFPLPATGGHRYCGTNAYATPVLGRRAMKKS